ncbi:hypothetical protein CRUP_038884 [Coryphaenoides rupestris]|nr:hypothetical protein CRUP_038884 [Coryphaenoides rupestris]
MVVYRSKAMSSRLKMDAASDTNSTPSRNSQSCGVSPNVAQGDVGDAHVDPAVAAAEARQHGHQHQQVLQDDERADEQRHHGGDAHVALVAQEGAVLQAARVVVVLHDQDVSLSVVIRLIKVSLEWSVVVQRGKPVNRPNKNPRHRSPDRGAEASPPGHGLAAGLPVAQQKEILMLPYETGGGGRIAADSIVGGTPRGKPLA